MVIMITMIRMIIVVIIMMITMLTKVIVFMVITMTIISSISNVFHDEVHKDQEDNTDGGGNSVIHHKGHTDQEDLATGERVSYQPVLTVSGVGIKISAAILVTVCVARYSCSTTARILSQRSVSRSSIQW